MSKGEIELNLNTFHLIANEAKSKGLPRRSSLGWSAARRLFGEVLRLSFEYMEQRLRGFEYFHVRRLRLLNGFVVIISGMRFVLNRAVEAMKLFCQICQLLLHALLLALLAHYLFVDLFSSLTKVLQTRHQIIIVVLQ